MFKVGDLVRGLCRVTEPYSITTKDMTKGEGTASQCGNGEICIKVLEHSCLPNERGQNYWVNPQYFELIGGEEEEEEMRVCSNCGCETEHLHDDLCEECYEQQLEECYICGCLEHPDDLQSVHFYSGGYQLVCEDCRSDNHYCNDCGDLLLEGEVYFYNGEAYCEYCYDNNGFDEDDGLHYYSYRPSPNFCKLEGEDTERFLGVELEMDDGCGRAGFVEYVHNDSRLYCKEDGSLGHNGVEIVSHPATLNYHLENIDWKGIMKEALSNDFVSHNGGRCGLHVHVSNLAFGEDTDTQELRVGRLLFFFSKFEEKLFKFSRRNRSQLREWASFYHIGSCDEEEVKDTAKSLKRGGRYYAINLQNNDTVEFRLFRGTLKYNTFVATLQLTDALVDVAIENTVYDIDSKNWDYFKENYFNTPELKQYFEERGL